MGYYLHHRLRHLRYHYHPCRDAIFYLVLILDCLVNYCFYFFSVYVAQYQIGDDCYSSSVLAEY